MLAAAMLDGPPEFAAPAIRARDADAGAFEAVEFAGVIEQRGVASLAHVFQNRRDNALGFFQALRLCARSALRVLIVDSPDHLNQPLTS